MKQQQYWLDQVKQLQFPNSAFINGQYFTTEQTYPIINPETSEHLIEMSACNETEVDFAVSIAKKTFEDGIWSGKAPNERKKVLKKLFIYGEFDSGSERTLAAWIRHASRTRELLAC